MLPAMALGLGLLLGVFLVVPVAVLAVKRAEARARELQRRAQQAEHLADVGTLTGGLAHEIRNPLSTLTLNLQLLREDLVRPGVAVDSRVAARLETLEHEGRRLQTILEDFLRFAGKQEVRLLPQSVNPVLEETLAFYRERLERQGIRVRTSLAPNLPTTSVDAARLKQAVSNLILNAEAAMPRGGELLVATEPDRGGVRLHITDTGDGIPPEALDKIFTPYYSTRPGGTGLGLPTVRRIVQEHNATLEVHGEPGRGTRFTIHLPGGNET